eukprot:NODE_277_length_10928_cov_0.583987.p5 type:complete len:358 gc:universal NODE_277_length_10928_cov_0.583987:3946-2873(-)
MYLIVLMVFASWTDELRSILEQRDASMDQFQQSEWPKKRLFLEMEIYYEKQNIVILKDDEKDIVVRYVVYLSENAGIGVLNEFYEKYINRDVERQTHWISIQRFMKSLIRYSVKYYYFDGVYKFIKILQETPNPKFQKLWGVFVSQFQSINSDDESKPLLSDFPELVNVQLIEQFFNALNEQTKCEFFKILFAAKSEFGDKLLIESDLEKSLHSCDIEIHKIYAIQTQWALVASSRFNQKKLITELAAHYQPSYFDQPFPSVHQLPKADKLNLLNPLLMEIKSHRLNPIQAKNLFYGLIKYNNCNVLSALFSNENIKLDLRQLHMYFSSFTFENVKEYNRNCFGVIKQNVLPQYPLL